MCKTRAGQSVCVLYLSPLEVDGCDDIAILTVAVTLIITVDHVSQDRRGGAETPDRMSMKKNVDICRKGCEISHQSP